MKKILLIISCLLVCGCGNSKMEEMKKIMEENEYVIVDVRTIDEYNEEHVAGAINIPYDQINTNTNLDKNKVIFVYCKSGARSEVAFNSLSTLGYSVYDLGGIAEIDLPKE